MTPQELKAFRTDLPDCELALYADIGSRTVLGADSALRYPQEYLDALCGCAADLFGALPGSLRDSADHVVFMGQTGGRIFVRNPSSPSEVLCCICVADAGAMHFVSAARSALRARGDAA